MSLAETEAALARVCLEGVVPVGALERLGGSAARWELYRAMVRGRYIDTVGESLPRTREALGDDGLAAVIARWLHRAPPTTRFARELCLQFSRFVLDDPSALPAEAPRWTLDLIRYESAVMEVVIACDPPPTGDLAPLDMALPVALSTTQRLVRLGWGVHQGGPPREGDVAVVVYRDAGDALGALELTAVAADIYEAMGDPARALEDCVRGALRLRRAEADPSFIEGLAQLLGDLIERGLILGGVRPR